MGWLRFLPVINIKTVETVICYLKYVTVIFFFLIKTSKRCFKSHHCDILLDCLSCYSKMSKIYRLLFCKRHFFSSNEIYLNHKFQMKCLTRTLFEQSTLSQPFILSTVVTFPHVWHINYFLSTKHLKAVCLWRKTQTCRKH